MKSRGKRPAAPVISSTEIRFGVDTVIGQPDRVPSTLFSGAWGMVTNDAARRPVPSAGTTDGNAVTDAGGKDADPITDPDHLSRKALLDAGVPLKQLFAPEHGLSAAGADGQAMEDNRDQVTGLPVCSLYGERMCSPEVLLDPLDGLLFDIPDVGARFYTYIWTLSHVMEACADADKSLVVLDRPNPIGGELMAAEGPMHDTRNCAGFLGRAPIPVRHSLTIGEFARWLAYFWKLDLDLVVIPVKGWKRAMHWPDTRLPFVPTSPAIPSYESALCYPGTALFESTNVSAGRGTTMPFRQLGAPWLRTDKVISTLYKLSGQIDYFGSHSSGSQDPGNFRNHKERQDLSGSEDFPDIPALPGVTFDEVTFIPEVAPWKGVKCRGIRLQVTDRAAFRPVRTGLTLLAAIYAAHPDRFRWEPYPTAANPSGEHHFEHLTGSTEFRPALENDPGLFVESLSHRLETSAWQNEVRNFLLYN